ncbi:MAG: SAM-dependent methyltransferase, partial [Nitriliruptor sp.]
MEPVTLPAPPAPDIVRAETPTERRARHAITSMLEQFVVGRVEVVLPDGRRRWFGDPDSELRSRIHVHDWRFFTRLLHGATVGVGESYMVGEWSSTDLVSLVRIVIANRRALKGITPAALANIASDKLIHSLRANRLGRSKRNIAAHYDLSNELYALFLDDSM